VSVDLPESEGSQNESPPDHIQNVEGQPVGVQPFPEPQDHLRPHAWAKALPGFMEESTVQTHFPEAGALDPQVQQAIRDRLGRSKDLPPDPRAGRPRFWGITERPVLANLQIYLAILQNFHPSAPSTINLIGFEWVEIAPLITGRLVTGRLSTSDQTPNSANAEDIARYCLFSAAKSINIPQDHIKVGPHGLTVRFSQEVMLTPVHAGTNITGQLTLSCAVTPVPMPIRILVAEKKTVALTGFGRLATLQQLGVERALCLVSYGYGLNVLDIVPKVPAEMLYSERPPLLRDFQDDNLSISIPVRPALTLTTIEVKNHIIE